MRSNPCTACDSIFHTAFSCPHKPKTTLKTHTKMSLVGRVGRETAKAVSKWKKDQKPNSSGYYECYLCGKWIDYLMAEHRQSKARSPELRNDPNNLSPVCHQCNKEKGSLSEDDYRHRKNTAN